MSKEPVAISAAVTAVIVAIGNAVIVFTDWDQGEKAAVMGVFTALSILAGALVARSKVSPVGS